jgi:3-methyladenine DNA glycosylase AlkD
MILLEIQKELRSMADAGRAKGLARFFKTAEGQYAHGDKFLGIMVPETRKLVKKHRNLPLREIGELLNSEFHEERLSALLILVAQYRTGDARQKEKIFDLYLKNRRNINNWDLVDLSAGQIVGAHLSGKDKKLLFDLARSSHLWDRRIAIISTFYDIMRGDAEIALGVAEKLVDDRHDLINKAVGWMLREVGKRCSLEAEEEFLDRHAATMPRTALRYAIERFTPKKKTYYMGMGKTRSGQS